MISSADRSEGAIRVSASSADKAFFRSFSCWLRSIESSSSSFLREIFSSSISGVIPFAWIDLPDGVKYLAVVSFNPKPSCKLSIDWTEPLPKDSSPIIKALLWSWSAPATISEADAEPLFINTTIGAPLRISPGFVGNELLEYEDLPSV